MANKDYYLAMIDKVAPEEGLRPELIPLMKRMVEIESSFNPDPKGNRKVARGIAQFTVPTAKAKFLGGDGKYHALIENGVDKRTDPEASLRQMARYLRDNDKRFNGDWGMIVADYNAGMKKKYRDARNLPAETKKYLSKVAGVQGYQSTYFPRDTNYEPVNPRDYVSNSKMSIRASNTSTEEGDSSYTIDPYYPLNGGYDEMLGYATLPSPQPVNYNEAEDKKNLQQQLDSYFLWLSSGKK